MTQAPTIHASAVLVGPRAILIRGPSGSGKSRLAWALLNAARTGAIPFARLVADDRVRLVVAQGRLLASPPEALAGLIELRGCGVFSLPHEPVAVVGQVIDLQARDAGRMPDAAARTTDILGVRIPRLPVAPAEDPLPLVLARSWPGLANAQQKD